MQEHQLRIVAELRLVAGASLNLLYGEDANMNGLLDANENDGDVSSPSDNRDSGAGPGALRVSYDLHDAATTGTNVSTPSNWRRC
jgi:hypothetical protein